MKKILLSLFVLAAFGIYVYETHVKNSSPITLTTSTPIATPTQDTTTQTPTPTQPADTTAPTPTSAGKYKNGTYTGPSTDAFYGNVQVQVIIKSGKISDVQFLDYPRDRDTSVRINSQATPMLREEALQAQNANVDIVSGATQTSLAFQQSLGAALDQAKS